MKKKIAFVLALLLLVVALCSCAPKKSTLLEQIEVKEDGFAINGVELLCTAEEMLEKFPDAKKTNDKDGEVWYEYELKDPGLGGKVYLQFQFYYDILVQVLGWSTKFGDELQLQDKSLVKVVVPFIQENLPGIYESVDDVSTKETVEESFLVGVPDGERYESRGDEMLSLHVANMPETDENGDFKSGTIEGYYFYLRLYYLEKNQFDPGKGNSKGNAEEFHAAKNK